jgi:hypothetical protein
VIGCAWNWLVGSLGSESLIFELNKGRIKLLELLVRIGFTREEATILIDEFDMPPDQRK